MEMNDYVNANKNVCAINCITAYLWSNKSIEASLIKLEEPEGYVPTAWNRELALATRKELEKASCDLDYLKKMLNKDRKTFISPSYKTLNDYMKGHLETNKSIKEIQAIIITELPLNKNDIKLEENNDEINEEEPEI